MTDDEFEQRLHGYYRAMDPIVVRPGLEVRVTDAIAGRTARRTTTPSALRRALTGVAALVIVAVGLFLGLRPGGFLSSPTPSPTAFPTTRPSDASIAPTSTASPAAAAVPVDLAGTFTGGVWALHGPAISMSTDAGATWRTTPIPRGQESVPTVFVLDPMRAWSVTPGPGTTDFSGSVTDILHLVVNRTTDGGQTWQASSVPGSYPGTGQWLVFVDAQHGYLLCSAERHSSGVSTILKTDDGGVTWSVTGTGEWLGSQFTASGPAALWSGAEQEAGPTQHPILDVSRDGGHTWRDARLPGLEGQLGGADLYLAGPPRFLDASDGFVTVSSVDGNGGSETRVYRTSDGGRFWSLLLDRPIAVAVGLAPLGAERWLLPEVDPGRLLVTDDAGADWKEIATSGLSSSGALAWIGAIDNEHAAAFEDLYVSGAAMSPLFLSADGGATWVPSDLGAPAQPQSSPSTSPTSTPSATEPPASIPWTNLDIGVDQGGPVSVVSVADGGNVVIGQASDGAIQGWFARNAYVALPRDTFGPASLVLTARCDGLVLVATQSATGVISVSRSADGATWTSSPAPRLRLARDSDLAGNATGAVAVLDEAPYRLAFTADGVTWQPVSVPGNSSASVQAVAAFGSSFVAVGEAGTNGGSPAAWWSDDGVHWTTAAVQSHVGDGFDRVYTGSDGLVAVSTTGETPGRTSFWTSTDGRSWTLSTSDPLGVWHAGEGDGNVNGIFSGDGTRLLVYGTRTVDGPTEYWTSLDGSKWTKLALAGDTSAAESGKVAPFLLDTGILFSGEKDSWFGQAEP